MRFALMTEPQQGLSYDEILALARTAETAGLEAFFRSDHYGSFAGPPDGPTTDAWATLAGLARDTATIRLGSLVSPITYRIPGSFAKVVATVDEMSGGRVEVGMGAGWNEEEHLAMGIPFPPLGERYDRLEESLAIAHGLWTEPDGWSYEGRHWQVRGARLRPRPTFSGRRHPHLILGGDGGPRLARLVASWADEFNRQSATPDRLREAYGRIAAACAAAGRDPDSVVRSAMVGVLVAETEQDLRDRVRQQIAFLDDGNLDAEAWLAERTGRWIIGTPDAAWERINALGAAGAQRIMLQDFLPRDLEMVALLGRIAAV
jgi:F420-dependent oxidoreductase-like protein